MMFIKKMMKIACVFSLLTLLFCSYSSKSEEEAKVINVRYSNLIDSAYFYINKNDSVTLSYFLKAFTEVPAQNPYVLYDAAIIASRLKQNDLAFGLLNLSIEKGYSYYEHMKKNKSLPLLDHDKFNKCLEKVRQRDSLLCEISKTLDMVLDQDQSIRNRYMELINKGIDRESLEVKAVLDSMKIIDSENLTAVNAIAGKYGFLGSSLKSEKSKHTMYLVYLHAPVEVIEDKLGIFKNAVKSGELQPLQYPYFEDRILTIRKGIQKYGTQYNLHKGEIIFVPFIDSVNVNKYREEFGMGTIEAYIKRIKTE